MDTRLPDLPAAVRPPPARPGDNTTRAAPAAPLESVYLSDDRAHVPLVGWIARGLSLGSADLAKAAGHAHVRRLLAEDVLSAIDAGDVDLARSRLASTCPAVPHEHFDESDPWCRLTRGLCELLGLSEPELAIVRLCDTVHRSRALAELLAAAVTGSEHVRRQCDAVAHVLGVPAREVRRAVDQRGTLRRREVLRRLYLSPDNSLAVESLLRLSAEMQDHLDDRVAGVLPATAIPFVDRPPAARFVPSAWPHLQTRLEGAARYLRASLDERAIGANVLLWGAPGTGKTELARSLAAAADAEVLQVRASDEDGRELDVSERLINHRLGTSIAASSARTLVVFDETEDILGAEAALIRGAPNERVAKSLVNATLETCAAPGIWIANAIDGIDEAYLRRFDIVLEVPSPPPSVRASMLGDALGDLTLPTALLDALSAHASVTPADIAKARRVVERSGAVASGCVAETVRETIDSELKGRGLRRLSTPRPSRLGVPDGRFVRIDRNADETLALFAPGTCVRLALVGPAGCGKSTWLHAQASRAGRAVVRCDLSTLADLGTESPQGHLRRRFGRAAERDAIVHVERIEGRFDVRPERLADGPDRWALALIEELSRHEGTAVVETRDARFADAVSPPWLDERIGFAAMATGTVAGAVASLLTDETAEAPDALSSDTLAALDGVSVHAGDLIAVERRLELGVLAREENAIVAALRALAAFRRGGEAVAIGFVSD